MTSAQKEGEWGLEISPVFADSIVFKQKIYCSFLWMGDWGSQRWGSFLWTS